MLNWLRRLLGPPTNATACDMLDQLDTFFVRCCDRDARYSACTEGRKLWNALTALRGPDAHRDFPEYKHAYTVPIRRAAFPKLAEVTFPPADFGSSDDELQAFPHSSTVPAGSAATHYLDHAYRAANDLNLRISWLHPDKFV